MNRKIFHFLTYYYLIISNALVKRQRRNPDTIPLIIINYNQLRYLKELVDFFTNRGHKNIVIIDNYSTYPPLLAYYETVKNSTNIKVERMNKNYGHTVFFDSKELQKKYGQGYYFLTDADILPNPNLPIDYAQTLIRIMEKNLLKNKFTKVGFALDIETIPSYYPLKEKVINWENKYWEEELESDVFFADIDTTFALYKPQYPTKFTTKPHQFYRAIRVAGAFTSRHMGWYLNPNNLTEEQSYYMATSSAAASWKFDKDGNLDSLSNY